MSRIRYLADEDFRRQIVHACLQLEPAIEFRTVQEVGLSSAEDDLVLEFAANESFIVVSHDKRTMPPAAHNRLALDLPMAGLFLIGQQSPIADAADDLALIWACEDSEYWRGQIEYLPWRSHRPQ